MKTWAFMLLILSAVGVGKAWALNDWNWVAVLNAAFGVYWAFEVWGYIKEGENNGS